MTEKLILIVEDNERNRKLLREVLRVKGYRTCETDSGEEAIQIARRMKPDLVLMDILLPGINGIEALRELRADVNTRSIPVIAVTASAMQEGELKVKNAGFDEYESKPVSIKALLAKIEKLLIEGDEVGRGRDNDIKDSRR